MTELALPKIDKDTISRKDQIVSHLKKFTKDENVLSERMRRSNHMKRMVWLLINRPH